MLWDEPGGCYDHVPPGPAQAPDDGRSPKPGQNGFMFDRYGARVPALLVSPYIAPGIVAPPGAVPFDHTSVIRTVRERFASTAGPLTKRDAAAPSLAHALTLGPDNMNLGPGADCHAAVRAAAGGGPRRRRSADDRLSALADVRGGRAAAA